MSKVQQPMPVLAAFNFPDMHTPVVWQRVLPILNAFAGGLHTRPYTASNSPISRTFGASVLHRFAMTCPGRKNQLLLSTVLHHLVWRWGI